MTMAFTIGNNYSSVPLSPLQTKILQGDTTFTPFLPFFGNDNNSFLNDDLMAIMLKFNSFLVNPWSYMPPRQFNTKTDMAAIKKYYNPKMSNALANIAYQNAMAKDSRHKCLQGVRESLTQKGLVAGTMGASAYQSADVLARNKNFKEVSVSREDLRKLPAGCVVVWNRNYIGTKSSDVHGHIAITTGDGGEASDHVSPRLYMLNASYRVFLPVGGLNRNA